MLIRMFVRLRKCFVRKPIARAHEACRHAERLRGKGSDEPEGA